MVTGLAQPRTILVRSPNWIGDQILAYPFFHFLRRAYPQARIGVACLPWVSSIQFRNLVDDVIELVKPVDPTWGARLFALEESARRIAAAGKKTAAGDWELGIALPNSLSSAWVMFRAGIKRRRGYQVDGRGLLLHEKEAWAPAAQMHRSDAYLQLLRREGVPELPAAEFWGVPSENELDPGSPGVLPQFDAERAWPGFELVKPPSEPYWVMAPGSAAESRRWPEEKFAALARSIREKTGLTGVIVGGPSEAPVASRLSEDRSLGLIDRTAHGPPGALTALFRGARFCVSNDSGLAHVAALCGATTYVVWGAGNPTRTRPIGPGRVQIMPNPVECWPCERNICLNAPGRKLECLAGIQPRIIWEEVERGTRA